jgi:hypothetical protein
MRLFIWGGGHREGPTWLGGGEEGANGSKTGDAIMEAHTVGDRHVQVERRGLGGE